jgi:hypothetical protein
VYWQPAKVERCDLSGRHSIMAPISRERLV